MSSRDILGPLVRALVTVPVSRLGIVRDLVMKLAGSDGAQWESEGKLFLRKQPTWENKKYFICEPKIAVDPMEPVLNPMIHVDRSVGTTYPRWAIEVMHPELENVGPIEYDITKVDQWRLEAQKTGTVTGDQIYASLKENGNLLLKTCLGLRDLEEIQKKGIVFFRKYLKGKVVFGWAGIVRGGAGDLGVPYLCEDGDEVILSWDWVDSDWDSNDPALRHAS